MPIDGRCSPFHRTRISEAIYSLWRRLIKTTFKSFILKVLFVAINCIILLHTHVNNWKKVSSWSSSRIRPSLPFYDCNLSSCSISSHEWSGVNIVHFIYIHICSYQRQMFFLPYAVLHWFTTSRILLHRNHKYCPGLMIFLCLPQSAKISRALQS